MHTLWMASAAPGPATRNAVGNGVAVAVKAAILAVQATASAALGTVFTVIAQCHSQRRRLGHRHCPSFIRGIPRMASAARRTTTRCAMRLGDSAARARENVVLRHSFVARDA